MKEKDFEGIVKELIPINDTIKLLNEAETQEEFCEQLKKVQDIYLKVINNLQEKYPDFYKEAIEKNRDAE